MLLDLKDAFTLEGKVMEVSGEIDLTDLEFYGVCPFIHPVRVTGRVANQNMVVRFIYRAEFECCRPCDRCLAETTKTLSYVFEHLLSTGDSGSELEDVVYVTDYRLELDPLVQEDILLELPTVFLCKPDCAGLCPVCGCDLNHESCGCSTEEHDSRLDALYDLL